jgi:hypothetical protein
MIKYSPLLAVLIPILLTACGGSPGERGATGPAGPAGSVGATGSTGASGASGSGGGIVSGFSCSRVESLAVATRFVYSSVTMADGSVFVSCGVADNYTQGSHAQVFHAAQNGASTKACAVTMDSQGAFTSGYWTFAGAGSKTTTYHDSGSPADGAIVTFAAGDCTTF